MVCFKCSELAGHVFFSTGIKSDKFVQEGTLLLSDVSCA
jgi:hypothetical protein